MDVESNQHLSPARSSPHHSNSRKKSKKPNRYWLQCYNRILVEWKKRQSVTSQVWFLLEVLLLLLLALLVVLCLVYACVWTFRHTQCYSREAGVTWHEGPSHRMTRPCPPVSYPTLGQQMDDPRPHICITTLTDEQSPSVWQRQLRCRDFDQVGHVTWPNRQAYANKHGYTLVDGSFLMDSSRPPAWSKIRAVQYLLSSNFTHDATRNPTGRPCDWVFWMDADTVILNSSIALESILPQDDDNKDSNRKIDLIVTMDRRFTANSGAWLIRAQSEFSAAFLAEWWDMKTWVREPGLSLSGDNAAFGHVIDSNIDSATDFKIQMVPRCTFNSFGVYLKAHQVQALALHPEQLPQQEWYQSPNFYHEGDFIGHASGIDQKQAGVEMLLQHAT